jgi:hypothetical protein
LTFRARRNGLEECTVERGRSRRPKRCGAVAASRPRLSNLHIGAAFPGSGLSPVHHIP